MLKPIKNNQQFENALERAYSLMQKDLKADSKESVELEVLSMLIKEYENKYYPIGKPTPIEDIKFRLEQRNRTVRPSASVKEPPLRRATAMPLGS